jgi:hypothetical protein
VNILNLTQHTATPEQIAAGVVELGTYQRHHLTALLTFDALPSPEDIARRAEEIADIAASSDTGSAMIGGALWLMAPLEAALRARSIAPVYAFSVRSSVDETLPDGSTRKVAVFRHAGFVPAV